MRIEQAIATNIQIGGKGAETSKPMRTLPGHKTGDRVALSVSKSTIDALSDVRMDRLEAVRKRVASGFYDKTEVRERIADAFLKHQSL